MKHEPKNREQRFCDDVNQRERAIFKDYKFNP